MSRFKVLPLGVLSISLLFGEPIHAGVVSGRAAAQDQGKEVKTAYFPFLSNGSICGSCVPCRPVMNGPIYMPNSPYGKVPYYRSMPYPVPLGGGFGGYSYPQIQAPVYSVPDYSLPAYRVPSYGVPGYVVPSSLGATITTPMFNSAPSFGGTQALPVYQPAVDSPYFP